MVAGVEEGSPWEGTTWVTPGTVTWVPPIATRGSHDEQP